MALLHALGCVCKFVLRCKNNYRIGPRQKMSVLWSKMSDIQNGLPNHVIKPFENHKKLDE